MKILSIISYYSDSDYCCPSCGKEATECNNEDWGYRCPDCDIYFETPDV